MKKAMYVLALPVRMSKSVDGVVMGLRHDSTTHVAEKLCSRSIQVLTSGRVMVLYFSTMVGLNFSHTSSGILGAFERLPTMNVAMFGSRGNNDVHQMANKQRDGVLSHYYLCP